MARKRTSEQPLTDEQWALVTENTGLARLMLNRHLRRAYPRIRKDGFDDICHDVCLPIMILAARNFRSSEGVRFSTYACVSLGRELPRRVRKYLGRSRMRREYPLTDLTTEGDWPDGQITDGGQRRIDAADEVERCLAFVTSRERSVLWMLIGDGRTLREVGAMLDLTQKGVRQIRDKAIARILKRRRPA